MKTNRSILRTFSPCRRSRVPRVKNISNHCFSFGKTGVVIFCFVFPTGLSGSPKRSKVKRQTRSKRFAFTRGETRRLKLYADGKKTVSRVLGSIKRSFNVWLFSFSIAYLLFFAINSQTKRAGGRSSDTMITPIIVVVTSFTTRSYYVYASIMSTKNIE